MAEGLWPHGTTMTFGGQPVGGLRTVPVEGGAKGQVDVTNHGSGGRVRTVPGLKASSTLTIEMLLIPGDPGQEEMIDNHKVRTRSAEAGAEIASVVVALPESVTVSEFPQLQWAFDAYVLDWSVSLPHDNNPATRTFVLSVESDPVEDEVGS